MPEIQKKFDNLSHLIGNTPLLEITLTYKKKIRRLFAKAEYFNFSGSIKDRMALHILRQAYRQKKLAPGARIAEATSGNTGISFAAIGTNLGYQVSIYMPDWMSEERRKLIQSFGAEIHLVSKEEGGFLGRYRKNRTSSRR
jgi:cysteine synthase A